MVDVDGFYYCYDYLLRVVSKGEWSRRVFEVATQHSSAVRNHTSAAQRGEAQYIQGVATRHFPFELNVSTPGDAIAAWLASFRTIQMCVCVVVDADETN